MVGREVECLEVVEVALDLRTEVSAVAEMMEDAHDLVHGLEQRMRDAGTTDGSGQRDVDSLHRCCLCRSQGGFERLLDLLLELVEAHTERLASLGGRGLEPGVGDELEASLFAAEPVE